MLLTCQPWAGVLEAQISSGPLPQLRSPKVEIKHLTSLCCPSQLQPPPPSPRFPPPLPPAQSQETGSAQSVEGSLARSHRPLGSARGWGAMAAGRNRGQVACPPPPSLSGHYPGRQLASRLRMSKHFLLSVAEHPRASRAVPFRSLAVSRQGVCSLFGTPGSLAGGNPGAARSSPGGRAARAVGWPG